MRIVFMGTPAFAVPSLEAVARAGHEIAAVVTNPDEPQGRGLKLAPPAVKTAAVGLGLPVIQTPSVKDPGFVERLKGLHPDLMVVVAFRILPPEVFTIPGMGTFNLHASLLPKYRGAAPINWAIINGERETGVTTFFLDEHIDTGNIILQKRTQIGPDETAGEVAERLASIGAEAVTETIGLIGRNEVHVVSQDSGTASRAPKISKEDCAIDWTGPAGRVHNFVRGFSPEPGAFTFLEGKLLKIFRTRPTQRKCGLPPGSLYITDGRLFAACADEFLEVVELQLEGRKKLGSSDFLRGFNVKPGSRLETRRGSAG